MKPVAVFRFSPTEGPGYFATFLDRHGIEWRLHALDQGAGVPDSALGFSGVALMGGPMSVNDPLPWIGPMRALLRDAVARDVPVIGHCLGGQLLASALGATVQRADEPEIGWSDVVLDRSALARSWFGDVEKFLGFHWHNETFSLPQGAVRIGSSSHCANQAYALGKHFGMQCHVEMTREILDTWLAAGELETRRGPGVQSREEIERDAGARLANLSVRADWAYTRWIEGLARG